MSYPDRAVAAYNEAVRLQVWQALQQKKDTEERSAALTRLLDQLGVEPGEVTQYHGNGEVSLTDAVRLRVVRRHGEWRVVLVALCASCQGYHGFTVTSLMHVGSLLALPDSDVCDGCKEGR